MSSLKIFRPWDLREDTVADKLENNNDIDVTDLTDQKNNDSISFRKHASNDSNIIRERIQEIRRSSEKLREKRTYLDDSKKSMCENNNKEQSSENNKQINNNIDDLQECTNKISHSQSKEIENRFHPRNESSESNERHHRRHSRKHRSRGSLEKNQDISLSSSPSNTTDTMASSILDLPGHIDPIYQTELFSNFEKQFYPDFRSLEFLPEDILDPILMSGLPLGAPLDPYWSNLALEYFKSHEASMKNKQQRPKKFNCPHCNVAFSNNGQLKGHIRIHTGERPFKCDAEGCGKSFTRNEELTRHKRIHSGLRPYPCSHCGKKFGRKDHLKKHLRTHFPQPRFVPCYSPYVYGGYASVML